MLDVLIAGAGPAGSIAGLVLARAGARVLIVDRDAFPRDKLCGDTLNPGAVRALAGLGLTGGPLAQARPLSGMLITGPHRAVRAVYPDRQVGLAILRRDLDAWLLSEAIRAGARFESGLTVRRPLLHEASAPSTVRGLVLSPRATGTEVRLPAMMTIAADGRRSVLARALELVRHPSRPRRWAFGTYATGVTGLDEVGEMHIRPHWYFGIAPLGNGTSNLCLVTGPRPDGRTPIEIVRRAIASDPRLRERAAGVTFTSGVRVLGPLAVDAKAVGTRGLLLAGDAGGFIDPMTGDGIHLAITSAVLAAKAALATLETGDFSGGLERLSYARRVAFHRKLQFNRFLRGLVDSPLAIDLASRGAAVLPGMVRRAVTYAGDAA